MADAKLTRCVWRKEQIKDLIKTAVEINILSKMDGKRLRNAQLFKQMLDLLKEKDSAAWINKTWEQLQTK